MTPVNIWVSVATGLADFSARDTGTAIKSTVWELDAQARKWPDWRELKTLLFTTRDLGPTNLLPEYQPRNRKGRNSQQLPKP